MEGVVIISDFLIHSTHSSAYLTYLLSFIAHIGGEEKLLRVPNDPRFVTIGSLEVFLHYGTVTALRYRFEYGRINRIPRIMHN